MNRHHNDHGGASAGGTLDVHGAAHQRGPLSHADETHAARGMIAGVIGRVEAGAAIFDRQDDVWFSDLESNINPVGAGVLVDVVERFLRDAKQVHLDVPSTPSRRCLQSHPPI